MLRSVVALATFATACAMTTFPLSDINDVVEFLNSQLNRNVDANDISVARIPKHALRSNTLAVYSHKSTSCGSGGCTLFILERRGKELKVLGKTTAVKLPITFLGHDSKGYPLIGVWVQGGGIIDGYQALLKYDGTSYPRSPTANVAERLGATSKGLILIPRSGND